jgi:hypothetical protein
MYSKQAGLHNRDSNLSLTDMCVAAVVVAMNYPQYQPQFHTLHTHNAALFLCPRVGEALHVLIASAGICAVKWWNVFLKQ